MEHIPGGTISSRLGSTGAFSEEETKRCMHQILEGLLFLHNQNIIHRDVKGTMDILKVVFGIACNFLCKVFYWFFILILGQPEPFRSGLIGLRSN